MRYFILIWLLQSYQSSATECRSRQALMIAPVVDIVEMQSGCLLQVDLLHPKSSFATDVFCPLDNDEVVGEGIYVPPGPSMGGGCGYFIGEWVNQGVRRIGEGPIRLDVD